MYRLFDRSGIEDGEVEEFHYSSSSSKMDIDDEEERPPVEEIVDEKNGFAKEIKKRRVSERKRSVHVMVTDETSSTTKNRKRRLESPTSPTEYFQKLKVRKVNPTILNGIVQKINEKSVLVRSGRTRTLEDALVDPSMATCKKCGAIIAKSRMPDHITYWCDQEATPQHLMVGGLFVSS
eukprot:g3747.t1